MASTQDGGDYTAGICLGKAPNGDFYITDVRHAQLSASRVENLLSNTASQDGIGVMQSIPQDPGAAGKSMVRVFAKLLTGYNVRFSTETGDKEVRATPVSAAAEAGLIKIVRAPWNDALLDELESFPNGAHDDLVDALSRAFMEHTKNNKETNTDFAAPVVGAFM